MGDFNISDLFNNPLFQFGTTLMGNARGPDAIGKAYTHMSQLKEMQQQAEYQRAQMENMRETRRISQEQYERQSRQTDQTIDMEKQKMETQRAFISGLAKKYPGLFGGGADQQQAVPQAAPMPPAPAPAPAPQPQAGGVLTPQQLYNLEGVESSHNPNAVNSESGAQGPFQFMPQTTAMMRRTDPSFNPFNQKMARKKAADYITNLTIQNGGDVRKALAAYGGFKSKDPTAYVNKILGEQAPQQPIAPVQTQPNAGMDLMGIGAGAALAGIGGGTQLQELGKALTPTHIPAGGYMRDPSGTLVPVPDPQGDRRLNLEQQRVGLEQRKNQYEMGNGAGLPQKALDEIDTNRFKTANTEIQKSFDLNKTLPEQFNALQRAKADVDELIAHRSAMTPIGYAANVKLTALKAFKNTFGQDAPADVVNAEDFNSAMAQLWMKAVKQVDQNPTAAQQKAIMQSFGTLQNDPKALQHILKVTQESFTKQLQRHNKAVAQYETKMGEDPYSRYLDPGQRTPAGTPVGGVEDGHHYLGGDPADPNAWSK